MRSDALLPRFFQQLQHDGEGCRALEAGPEEPVRKRVGRGENAMKQFHDAPIPPAIAGDHEAKPVTRVHEAISKFLVLRRKFRRKILQAVVPEVTVYFAIDGKLLVVQGLIGRPRTLKVEGSE